MLTETHCYSYAVADRVTGMSGKESTVMAMGVLAYLKGCGLHTRVWRLAFDPRRSARSSSRV